MNIKLKRVGLSYKDIGKLEKLQFCEDIPEWTADDVTSLDIYE